MKDTAVVGDIDSMIKSVTTINEYDGFINSFLDNSKFSDPHLTARIEAGEMLDDMIAKKDHYCSQSSD